MTGRTRLWDSDWEEIGDLLGYRLHEALERDLREPITLAANPFLPALPWISWEPTPATWLESRTTEIIREAVTLPPA